MASLLSRLCCFSKSQKNPDDHLFLKEPHLYNIREPLNAAGCYEKGTLISVQVTSTEIVHTCEKVSVVRFRHNGNVLYIFSNEEKQCNTNSQQAYPDNVQRN